MNGGRIFAALCLLAFLAPMAQAADAQIDLRSELPLAVTGDHATTGQGAFHLEGDQGRVSLLVQTTGSLERVVHRAFGYVSTDPSLGVLWEQRVEREELELDGFITLKERLPTFQLLAYDSGLQMAPGAGAAPLHIGQLSEAQPVTSTAEPPIQFVIGEREAAPFQYNLRSGLYSARSLAGIVGAEGPVSLYLEDAVVRYDTAAGPRLLEAHYREEQHPGQVYDPVARSWIGGGQHTEYVHEYHVLQLEPSSFQLQYYDSPALFYAATPTIAVDGAASFPQATGTVAVTEAEETTIHKIDGEDLLLAGRFTFALTAPDVTGSTTAVQGSGDLTEVSYAASTHEYDWTAVAVAGFGALLLGLVAWFTGGIKAIGGALTGLVGGIFGYARVHGEEILQHDGRREVYEIVQASPGLHFVELGDKLPFGASTLNYHLRVLEKNGYVTRVKDGRYVRFFDRHNGQYSRDRKTAASTLRNDKTAAIAAYIIEHPGVVQRDLAQHFGVAPSTVSWHISRLQKDGLVDKQRDQHFTRYYMGRAWSDLPTAELARVGLVA